MEILNKKELFICWDIETSTVPTTDGGEVQVVYLSNIKAMNYETEEVVFNIFHREMREVLTFFKSLDNMIEDEVVVYAHNLSYELDFFIREGKLSSTMKNTLIRGGSYISVVFNELPHIRFKDSFALFNKSVDMLGKDINLPKLEYDYKKVRTPFCELEPLDYEYNERDNTIVLLNLIKHCKERGYTPSDIPLTFTGEVKRMRQNEIGKEKVSSLMCTRGKVIKDIDFYDITALACQGGLTTATENSINVMHENVYGIDIKSSYPYIISRYKFPRFYDDCTYEYNEDRAKYVYERLIKGKDRTTMRKYGIKGFIGKFKVKELRLKEGMEGFVFPLSLSKVYFKDNYNYKHVNGKVKELEEGFIILNDVNYDILSTVYEWDEITPTQLFTTDKEQRLNEDEIKFVLKHFSNKETIKDKESIDYILSKIIINAIYGIKVQKMLRDVYFIIDGELYYHKWLKSGDDTIQEQERKNFYTKTYNKQQQKTGFDIFQDGMYITDFARLNLITTMKVLYDKGFNIIYCDTDSIKFNKNGERVDEEVKAIIDEMNEGIIKANKNDIIFKKAIKEGLGEVIFNLGKWEIESVNEIKEIAPYKYFKTLGAKKYAYIDYKDEIKTTIAGCSKNVGKILTERSLKIYDITPKELLDIVFSVDTMFSSDCSGRKVARQETRELEEVKKLKWRNAQGEEICLNSAGGMILEDTTYYLDVSSNDAKILNLEDDRIGEMMVYGNGEIKVMIEKYRGMDYFKRRQ